MIVLTGPLARATDASPSLLRHDLFVQIDPERHALTATDRLTLELTQARAIQFSLAPTLRLDRLVLASAMVRTTPSRVHAARRAAVWVCRSSGRLCFAMEEVLPSVAAQNRER